MFSRVSRWLNAALALAVVCQAAAAGGAGPRPAWKPAATRQYLDERIAWWLDWPSAARGQGTSCASCHTTLPYAVALPALARLPGGEQPAGLSQRLLDGVRKHVEKWDELAASQPAGEDPLKPIFGGAKRDAALDTEAVLNALTLVANETAGKGKLSDAAGKALDVMWSRQQANGSWRWLDFGFQPWEKDGEYFGAALAAVAVGSAGDRYTRHDAPEVARNVAALRKYLKAQPAGKTHLHNTAMGLWAAGYLPGLFSDDEKKRMIADLCAVQGEDGGWSLRDLGKASAAPDGPGWAIHGSFPKGAVSDGYATGLVVLALKKAGVANGDKHLARGLEWLSSRQEADGTWPVVYVNVPRNPAGNVGKFNRDAGAAFALLALLEAN